MKFIVQREMLLKPVQLLTGIVEKRQTNPILSHLLFQVRGHQASLTATDGEIELVVRITLQNDVDFHGEMTLPAFKLFDIIRSLPEHAELCFEPMEGKVKIASGNSRFNLLTLNPEEFPKVQEEEIKFGVALPQQDLKYLISKTAFAMAQQDVRHYLNGLLLEFRASTISAVATDGHRLALCQLPLTSPIEEEQAMILPRKAVLELVRLLGQDDQWVELMVGKRGFRVSADFFTFTSRLVEGQFPRYRNVIPDCSENEILFDVMQLKSALSRVSILSNEKYRGVRLSINKDQIRVSANNPEQEEAEENIEASFHGDSIEIGEIGFNCGYLQDVLSVVDSECVRMNCAGFNSSVRLEEAGDHNRCIYVVMPMHL